jgi:tol-pal system protein YbgF
MRRSFHTLQILLLATLLAGCMAPQPPRLEQDLEEMKRRLAANEQTVVALRKEMTGKGDGQLDNLNRSQADLKADLDALRAETLAQSGQFDDLHSVIKAQQGQLQQLRDELDFKLRAIEERLARLEAEPAKKPSVPQAELSPEALYQQGLDLVRGGTEFARGRQLLTEFAKKYPQHALTINAKYWAGEAWYGEKKYENAILQFQDVIQEYGDHPKVAAALLKQALSFQALGDKENSRVILNKLAERFPLSDEAKKAKELLGH